MTIDAMGCQREIAANLQRKEADYVLALKGNQATIHDDVRLFLEDDGKRLTDQRQSLFAETVEKDHGRIEIRRCYVTDAIDWLLNKEAWAGLKTIVMIHSIREIDGKQSEERRFYLSSLPPDPGKLLGVIRSHWGIENSLHWVLDMTFGEDQSRIRKVNAPENMAMLRKLTFNLLQKHKKNKRQSIKRLRKVASWDNGTLASILSGMNA